MAAESVTRLLETFVVPPRGGEYRVWVHARPRSDGRWEGALEFRPQDPGATLMTGVETTQSSSRAVFDWAAGLGAAFLEGAFERAWRRAGASVQVSSATPPRLDGPLDPSDHGARIESIAREILSLFERRRSSRLRTDLLFNRTTHANADLVRAFELLETQWRLVVRRTVEGADQLELTPLGAETLGIPAPGAREVPDRPHPRR